MSKKNIKTKNNRITKKDEKISSVIEIKEKDNKCIYVLILIIAILLSLLIYFIFFNKCENKKEKCENQTIEVEVDPKYQLVNYYGFVFKMPLEWDFVKDSNENSISNKEESIYISFDLVDIGYDTFISNEYQTNFLEKLQTSDNIKIDNSKSQDNYYTFEGTFNNYKYLIIAIGNESKTILVKTQFIDNVTFDNMKNNIIDFAINRFEKSDK